MPRRVWLPSSENAKPNSRAADAVIRVAVIIEAPVQAVWDNVADLASHVEWMGDAESIEFRSDVRHGVGAEMVVATRVGPLRTNDVIEVVSWEPPTKMGVIHRGLVSGEGSFELTPMAGGTRFAWKERLSFPWWLGGPLTALLAGPVLAAIWRGNLDRLKQRIELV